MMVCNGVPGLFSDKPILVCNCICAHIDDTTLIQTALHLNIWG